MLTSTTIQTISHSKQNDKSRKQSVQNNTCTCQIRYDCDLWNWLRLAYARLKTFVNDADFRGAFISINFCSAEMYLWFTIVRVRMVNTPHTHSKGINVSKFLQMKCQNFIYQNIKKLGFLTWIQFNQTMLIATVDHYTNFEQVELKDDKNDDRSLDNVEFYSTVDKISTRSTRYSSEHGENTEKWIQRRWTATFVTFADQHLLCYLHLTPARTGFLQLHQH